MTLTSLPKDSALLHLARYMESTEVPFSYSIASGLSTIGVLLKRSRWVDQVDWRVHPNQSILLIGPSGVGKDTAINRTQSSLQAFSTLTRIPVLGGCTLEGLHARLADLPSPACAFLPAPELTSFFGRSDYQANMLTGITNLLSGGEAVDITTKGSLLAKGGPTIIRQPTLTMHGGSTVEWLHKGMPEGTLEGGFMGRFLIVIEEIGSKFIPLIKSNFTSDQIRVIQAELASWKSYLGEVVAANGKPQEVILLPEAEDLYINWYRNRFRIFSKAVMPYANRSRDMVLRLALLMAASRRHWRWIDGADMTFGIELIGEIARKIDAVVLPPSAEAALAGKVLELLPATIQEIYQTLGLRYSIPKNIDPAIQYLLSTGQMRRDGNTMRQVQEA